jgi:TIR domain
MGRLGSSQRAELPRRQGHRADAVWLLPCPTDLGENFLVGRYTGDMPATGSTAVRAPFKVFISYEQNDLEFARSLTDCLAENGFRPWLDWNDVQPGDNSALKAGEALRDADAMVVVISAGSVGNRHIQPDLNYALVERRFAGRLIPVLPDERSIDALPRILKRFQFVQVLGTRSARALRYWRRYRRHYRERIFLSPESPVPPREVVLSHASADSATATAIARTLRAHGVPVWYSQTNILGAQQRHDETGAALQRCDWFVLLDLQASFGEGCRAMLRTWGLGLDCSKLSHPED